jgi:hypothetical protein
VKTQSDLVVMPRGARISAFFCFPRDRTPQNSWCAFTVQSFHTAWVNSGHSDATSEWFDRLREAWPTKVLLFRTLGRLVSKAAMILLSLQPSPASEASAFNKMRAFAGSTAVNP